MKTWFIKTVYGFDMVAKIDESKSTETEYAIVDPLRYELEPHPTNPQARREGFAEIVMGAKESVEEFMLQKVHVFMKYEPIDRITNNHAAAIKDLRLKRSGLVGVGGKSLQL